MPKVDSPTSAYSLPSLSLTKSQAQYLKIAGVALLILTAGAYLRGKIGTKVAFTATMVGGAMVAAGFFGNSGSPKRSNNSTSKELAELAQYALKYMNEIGDEYYHYPKSKARLLLACARQLPTEASRLMEEAQKILPDHPLEDDNSGVDVPVLLAEMELAALQTQSTGSIPEAIETRRADWPKKVSLALRYEGFAKSLSAPWVNAPRELFYDFFKEQITNNNALTQEQKTALFGQIVSILPETLDVDVADEYRTLVGIASGLCDEKNLPLRHFDPFHALMSTLAKLPEEHFEDALNALMQNESFKNPKLWPYTDAVVDVVARAPRAKLFDLLMVLPERTLVKSDVFNTALDAYAKMDQNDRLEQYRLFGEMCNESWNRENLERLLMSVSRLDPSEYRPMLNSLIQPNVSSLEESSIQIQFVTLWERGKVTKVDFSANDLPEGFLRDGGALPSLLEVLQSIVSNNVAETDQSVASLLEQDQIRKVLLESPSTLRALFEWICDPACYTNDPKELFDNILDLVSESLEKRQSKESLEHLQHIRLTIAEREPSKKAEIVEALLKPDKYYKVSDFLWKHKPTLALKHYLALETRETQNAMLHLTTFYPFEKQGDNVLVKQLLTNLFRAEELDCVVKADILNLLAHSQRSESDR